MNVTATAPAHHMRTSYWNRLVQTALLLTAVLLLVPLMSAALPVLHKDGLLPFKPRDFKMFLSVVSLLLVLLSRPAFCLPALALLTLPLARLLDAGLLQRFTTQQFFDDHETYVLNLASDLLSALIAILCLFTPGGKRIAIFVATGTALVVVGSIAYEFMGMAEYTSIPGRAAGFLEDPNAAGIILCLCLGVVLTMRESFWWNVAHIGLSFVGNAMTLSRSGTMGLLLITVCYVSANFRRKLGSLLLIAAIVVPVAGIGIAMLGESTERKGAIKDDNAHRRMEAIYEFQFEKLWSDERAKDLLDGWEAAQQKPVFGHGTGAGTFWWMPHNEIVSLWVDLGIGGPLLYLSLLGYLTWCIVRARMHGFYCLIALLFYIPFSQILIENVTYWFCAGVATCVASPKRYSLSLRSRHKIGQPTMLPSHA